MTDHETTLREFGRRLPYLDAKDLPDIKAACLAGADALARANMADAMLKARAAHGE